MNRLATTAFSMLDLVPVHDQGTLAQAFNNAVDLAQHLDSLEFTRYWLAEHHNIDGIASAATAVLIGHIAGKTNKIRVGSGGIMLPNHAPLIVAENFGTLDALYPNRIDLGIWRAPGTDQATMRALRRGLEGAEHFPQQLQELQHYLAPSANQGVIANSGTSSPVPIWLLGSSLFSAQLAVQLGLRYSFASHFAPRLLFEAIHTYSSHFKPSASLAQPYFSLGVPLIVAPTDEEAQYLATTSQQRIQALFKGQSVRLKPPVENMAQVWNSPQERQAVDAFLAAAIIGSPQTARTKLETLLEATQANELIFVCDIYDNELRKRSFTLVNELKRSA